MVGDGSVIEDSIVLPNAIIGRNCIVKNAIVNEGVVTDDNAEIGDPDGEVSVFGRAKLSI